MSKFAQNEGRAAYNGVERGVGVLNEELGGVPGTIIIAGLGVVHKTLINDVGLV